MLSSIGPDGVFLPGKQPKDQQSEAPPDRYITGCGTVIYRTHSPNTCAGSSCVIHNPSDHAMRAFPTHWRADRHIMERICPHGVGHPDPDAIMRPEDGVHGCDGCCMTKAQRDCR